jgi:hypothetical protein
VLEVACEVYDRHATTPDLTLDGVTVGQDLPDVLVEVVHVGTIQS